MQLEDFIPWDKSWLLRMGVLDILAMRDQIGNFLHRERLISEDLVALMIAADCWYDSPTIDVKESGTLFRFLQYASWKKRLDKHFIRRATLADRNIAADPHIIELSQAQLLTLDNGTSQWASAAALCGDETRLPDPPYKLDLTYRAIHHWRARIASKQPWEPRRDSTIKRQAEAFDRMAKGHSHGFTPQQAEDFCFAYTFCGMSSEEGEARWPSLRGHESDRIVEMKRALNQAKRKHRVTSRDHRVVQAVGMWSELVQRRVEFSRPHCVQKSWPRFWEFTVAHRAD